MTTIFMAFFVYPLYPYESIKKHDSVVCVLSQSSSKKSSGLSHDPSRIGLTDLIFFAILVKLTDCKQSWFKPISGIALSFLAKPANRLVIFCRRYSTGKLRNACRKGLGIVRNMFDNNTIEDLPLAA